MLHSARDALEAIGNDDLILFRAVVERRRLRNKIAITQAELAAVEAEFFPTEQES